MNVDDKIMIELAIWMLNETEDGGVITNRMVIGEIDRLMEKYGQVMEEEER